MANATDKGWSTARTLAALRDRFKLPEFAFLTEVGDATGFSKCRSADALAMSCWPSRGLNLYGFEIKVSRSDWVKERDNPAKAERICAYCDYWYVVAGRRDIVKTGELPPTWGLMEPRGEKLVVTREAPKLEARSWSRAFLAALLRRTAEGLGNGKDIEEAKCAAYRRGLEVGSKQAQDKVARELEQLKNDAARLEETIAMFERTTGLHFDRWRHGAKLSNAIRFVLNGGMEVADTRLRDIENQAREILQVLEKYREIRRDLAAEDSSNLSC